MSPLHGRNAAGNWWSDSCGSLWGRGAGGGFVARAGELLTGVGGMGLCIRRGQVWKQRAVMRTDDVFVEEAEHDAGEFAVAVFLEMLEGEGTGDDFAAGIGLAFGLFVAGFERLQLGVELVAFFLEEFEAVG
jgi:hypothetical protein